MVADSNAPSPRRQALDWLARREHSLAELRVKLEARNYSREEIDRTVGDLAREGLASDERFVESFVATRKRKGQGPVRIRTELERRGIAAELIVTQLEVHVADWDELARSVRRKKFGAGAPRDYREWTRQARFLQYRGFSGEQIRRVLDDVD